MPKHFSSTGEGDSFEQQDYSLDTVLSENVLLQDGPKKSSNWLLDFVSFVVLFLVLSFVLRSFIVESYIVPTGSMLETIQLGDCLLGEKISYRFREPQQGEIVTFTLTDASGAKTTLVKRVIAVGGQTIDLVEGQVVVDGRVLSEPYTNEDATFPLDTVDTLEISYPYTVPQGYLFVMGDNRSNSSDSRYFGPIAVESVSSRIVVCYWPIEDAGLIEES